MTLSEEAAPLNERFLFTRGIVSEKALTLVRNGLSLSPSPNGRLLFLGFTYADLDLGKTFSFVFPDKRPQDAVATEAVITAATEQWGTPLEGLPHGWKTIALVEFPLGVPTLIETLPVIDEWYGSDVIVCLANQETLGSLLSAPAPGR